MEERVRVHMGRMRHPSEAVDPMQADPERALERIEDGCPGGDQRSRFLESVLRYYRRLDSNRNRVPNPHLERDDVPDVVVEALLYYEQEEEHCEAYRMKLLDAKLRKERGPSGA